MSDSFVHLHCHSEFSLLDGAAKIEEMVSAAKADNQPALALTDHGAMYGIIPFYKECKKQGINAIVGNELYMAKDHRSERLKTKRNTLVDDEGGDTEAGGKQYYHLTALAENNEGYKNLIQLSSRAFLEGYYRKPRVDWELLEQHSAGVIVTTGCLGGQVLQALLHGQQQEAVKLAARLQDIFGKDNLFVEIQDHGIKAQHDTYQQLLDVAKAIKAPIICSNDCLVGDTIVATSKGPKPISEVTVGDRVLTAQNEFRPVTKLFSRELRDTDDGLFDVKARVGSLAFTATGNHKVLVAQFSDTKRRDAKVCSLVWVKCKDLLAGRDYLTIPKSESYRDSSPCQFIDVGAETCLAETKGLHSDGEWITTKGHGSTVSIPCQLEINEELLFVLGFYMANGCADINSFRISFSGHIDKTPDLLRISRYFEQFGCSPKLKVVNNGAEIAFSSRVFNSLLPKLCGRGSNNKHFPTIRGEYVDWNESQFLTLCEGWFAGDGCRSRGNLSVSTTSRLLVFDAAQRFHRLGLPVVPSWGGASGVAKNERWAQVWQLTFGGSKANVVEDALKYHKMPEVPPSKFFLDIGSHWAVSLQGVTPSDVVAQVYDLTVDDHHSYTANMWSVSNSHYVNKEDALMHDSLLCVQTRSHLSDPDRFKFESDQHYLKTAEEMRYLFREVPTACDNTLLIAERANVDITFGEMHLPHFPVPEGFPDTDAYLTDLVLRGAQSRYPNLTDETVSRIVYELRTISDLGLSAYFLIVWDLLQFARREDIRVGPGRGSSGGSCVAYCLNITQMDPLKYGLLFERFLDPNRVALPDIDIDISAAGRDKMIDYCAEKYGRDHVAQIVTFSMIKARAAVRDSTRILGLPFTLGDRIAKAMPLPIQGRDAPLSACFKLDENWPNAFPQAQALRDLHESDPDVQQVISIALGLEGLRRQDGVHAAAVVVSDAPITDYLPIQRKGEDEPIVTQYEMHAVDELGLLKMDFLGLRNLDVIQACLEMIPEDLGDLDKLPLDDQPTMELFRRGDTVGVFQLESKGCQDLLRRLRPTSFEDIAAVLALYRPGPMGANMHNDYADRKNGIQPVVPYHPDAAELFKDTYQLPCYQESLMLLAQRFAGYELAEAYKLLKACAKKIPAAMAAHKDTFIEGCVTQGYERSLGEAFFAIVEKFAAYGFNKCIAGDTVLTLSSKNQYFDGTITIEELHRRATTVGSGTTGDCLWCGKSAKASGLCGGCKAWHYKFHRGKLMALAYDHDGRIRPKPIKAIHANGVKPLWRVTLEDGRHLDATEDHRHLGTNGWKTVSELRVGDSLVTHEGVDRVSGMALEDLRTTTGERVRTGSVNGAFGDTNYGYIDGGFTSFVRMKEKLPAHCQIDPTHSGRLEVAHMDGNRRNNSGENLKRLCVSCHKKHDYRNNGRVRKWEKGHLAGESRVVSIEYIGCGPTYDLEMDDPLHNFVANGILTHNSHSVLYGLISYQTAYLKANYPTYYMAALAGNAINLEAQSVALAESRRMGVSVKLPGVNTSGSKFTATSDDIRVGFESIKSVGSAIGDLIVEEREENGRYKDIFDFCFRLKLRSSRSLTTKNFQALAESGAFDEFGESRMGLIAVRDEILKAAVKAKERSIKGQGALFDLSRDYKVPVTEYSDQEKLALEKANMGIYVSGHPMDGFTHKVMKDDGYVELAALASLPDETRVVVVGVVSAIELKKTRAGEEMCHFTMEDPDTTFKITAFPANWAKISSFTKVGSIYSMSVRCTTGNWGDRIVVLINGKLLDGPPEKKDTVLDERTLFRLFIPEGLVGSDLVLSKLKGAFLSHRGPNTAILHVGRNTAMKLPNEYGVEVSPELIEECRRIFEEAKASDPPLPSHVVP